MVGHEDPSVHSYIESGGAITDTVSERRHIFIAGETNVSVVPALHDVNGMTGMTGRAESWWTWHCYIVNGIRYEQSKPKEVGIA
jgi:hypothetical protein